MNLIDLLAIEQTNTHHIYFYREGVFYKAYERSAYLFVTNFRPFLVKKRMIKSVNQVVVSIGFPTNSLRGYFGEGRVHEEGSGAIVKLDKPIDTEAYENWKQGIALTEMPTKVVLAKEEPKPAPAVAAGQLDCDIAMQVRLFPLEGKTPLECMMFLSELKKRR